MPVRRLVPPKLRRSDGGSRAEAEGGLGVCAERGGSQPMGRHQRTREAGETFEARAQRGWHEQLALTVPAQPFKVR